MHRKRKTDLIYRLLPDDVGRLQDMGGRAVRWAAENIEKLPNDPDMGRLDTRSADNWRPLYIVAEAVGGHWPKTVRHVAQEMCADTEQWDGLGVELLRDCQDIFERRAVAVVHSETLRGWLVDLEERPWREFNERGRELAITQKQIAELLSPFGITPKQVRAGDGRSLKGYRTEWFTDAFERYLDPAPPFSPETPKQSSDAAGFEGAAPETSRETAGETGAKRPSGAAWDDLLRMTPGELVGRGT
jgi:hypothetical protein